MMKKLKISIVVYCDFPIEGGYENLVYDLTKNLSLKAEIHVICVKKTNIKKISDEIKVFPILKYLNIKYIGPFYSMLISIFNFYFYLRKERPDVINAHLSFPAGSVALIPAKLLKIPLICTSHGGDIQINKEIGYGLRLNKFLAFLIRLTLRYTDVHTIVSNSMLESAVDSGSKISKIFTIENGINLPILKKDKFDILHKKFKIEKNDFVILFLGRLHPKKRPEDLIKAFSLVHDDIPNSKLIIAGSGIEDLKLKLLTKELNIENKVIFTGFVSSENGKWELLNRCNIFVLPSIMEGLPIAVIEAMGYGKPVIATEMVPFTDIIKNMETGLLVEPKSPEKISKAILELAKNKENRIRIGLNAKNEFNERFTIEKISDKYLRLYEDTLYRK